MASSSGEIGSACFLDTPMKALHLRIQSTSKVPKPRIKRTQGVDIIHFISFKIPLKATKMAYSVFGGYSTCSCLLANFNPASAWSREALKHLEHTYPRPRALMPVPWIGSRLRNARGGAECITLTSSQSSARIKTLKPNHH